MSKFYLNKLFKIISYKGLAEYNNNDNNKLENLRVPPQWIPQRVLPNVKHQQKKIMAHSHLMLSLR
jgi:hypothetical protein